MGIKTAWYIRTYRCDNGIEYKTKFPVRETETLRRNYSKMRTAVRRAEKGATEARTELGRLLNCNFTVGRDMCMGMDFSDEALAELERRAGSGDRDALYMAACAFMSERYIKRLHRACAKAGVELRYAFVVSDMDGAAGQAVRVHVHMVINSEAAEAAREKWHEGGVWARELYSHHHGDLQELADYMISQVRYFPNAKRFRGSRNLKKAVAGRPVKARTGEAELAVPGGCVKIYRSEYHAGRPQQIRYWRPPEMRGGKKTWEAEEDGPVRFSGRTGSGG